MVNDERIIVNSIQNHDACIMGVHQRVVFFTQLEAVGVQIVMSRTLLIVHFRCFIFF